MEINVYQLIEGARLARGLTVIIDVFRAFTVEAYLAANGAERIIPIGDAEEAYEIKRRDPNVVLIGERGGRMLPGFDFGNSPSQIKNVDFRGKICVHTTSAGTQGIVNAENASEIITGSLVNARAVAEYIKRKKPEVVSLVCMGLSGKTPTDEDTLCADYIKSILDGAPIPLADRIEGLKRTSGAKFFDEKQRDVFPTPDFYLSCEPDRFGFALRVEKDADGLFTSRKINVL
ncbi:MAG: 2-phosphosulfolactate phosphatase [Clostridia bacterium]|nr:2-phosphosulfolactate phosphatase [Clostridia bacterium]